MDYMTMNFNRNGGSGTSDYSQLSNKPQINGVTLSGNKTSADLGIQAELDFDTAPTENSVNPVTSGGLYAELTPTVISKSGNPITISDACALNCKSLEMDIEVTQDLNGYDKPWAGGAGKNLYVGSPSFDGYTNISLWTLQDEKYNGHDVYKKSTEWGGTSNRFFVEEGIYTFSVMVKTGINTNAFIYIIDSSDVEKATVDVISKQVSTSTSWTKVQCTFTVTSAGFIATRIELGSNNDIYISEYQLEQGSTATNYEPYANICPITGISTATITNGTSTASITLGEEVFGGTIDFNSGIVNITHGVAIFDGSNDEGWVKNIDTTNNSYTCEVNEQWEPFWAVDQSSNGVSNEFNVNGEVAYWGTDYSMAYSNGRLYVGFPKASTLAEFTRALASNNLQIVGKLATPRTLTLTPSQLALLASGQTVSGNGAEIRLSYLKRNIAGQIIEEVKSLD